MGTSRNRRPAHADPSDAEVEALAVGMWKHSGEEHGWDEVAEKWLDLARFGLRSMRDECTPNTPNATDSTDARGGSMSTINTIAALHPDVLDSLKDDDWTDAEIGHWLAGHNASVRREVLKEEPSDAECIAVLNVVSVPFGEPPATGDWAQAAIRRCREALMAARRNEGSSTVANPFPNWQDRIAKACEGRDVNSSDLDIREVVEYAGVKDGEIATSWTKEEGDIRSDSNYLDGMVKRTTTYINARASASTPEEHVAGKHTRGSINGGQ